MFIFYLFGNIWREDISFRIVWLSTLCVCFSTSCFTLVVTSYLLIYLRETVVIIECCRVLANLLSLLLCFFLAAFFMLPTRELSASDLLSTIALFLLFLLIQLILFVSERIFLCLETSVFITTCLVSKLEPTKEFFLAVAMQVFYFDEIHEGRYFVVFKIGHIGINLCDLRPSLLKQLADILFCLNFETPCLRL